MVTNESNSEETNLSFLGRSRKKIQDGDVFVFQILDGPYRFCRVIAAEIDEELAPMPNSSLLYIYRTTSETMVPPVTALAPDQLLVPPVFTNRQGWLKGYFK